MNPDMTTAFLQWCGDQPATFWWGIAALIISTVFLVWADRIRAETRRINDKGQGLVSTLHNYSVALERKLKEIRYEQERLERSRSELSRK